ncbi:MAG: type II toxin-antitoxin system HicB family antitoxin [Bacillota bacterium]
MKKVIYPACFYAEENGQFTVIFPDFEGATYGNNINDAYEMATDFLGGMIAELEDSSEQVPLPCDIKEIKLDKSFPNGGFTSLISADVDKYRNNRAVKKTLTIPAWLNDEATKKKVNFSKVLQEALMNII